MQSERELLAVFSDDEGGAARPGARCHRRCGVVAALSVGGVLVALAGASAAWTRHGRLRAQAPASLYGSKAATGVTGSSLPRAHGVIETQGGLCLGFKYAIDGQEANIEACSAPLMSPLQSWVYDAQTKLITTTNGHCLDGGGEHIHLWDCDPQNANQKWEMTDGGRKISHAASKRCLGAGGDGNAALLDCAAAYEWTSLEPGGARQIRFGPRDGWCLHADSASGSPERFNLAAIRACAVRRQFVYDEATKMARHHDTDLCITPDDPSASGSKLRLRRCDAGNPFQRLTYFASGQLSSVTGFCVDTSQPDRVDGEVHLWACSGDNPNQRWHFIDTPARPGAAPPSFVPRTPVQEFYVYRAVQAADEGRFPFGNVNAANMAGLMWYLMNEVVTEYTAHAACPRKFGIDEIRRFRVRMRQTVELASQGHHFGARFAYDRGQCVGRCFPQNQCTCHEDCEAQYGQNGYVVGCNNFRDHYPFPDSDTQSPDGVWYSFPSEGKCDYPTGGHDCTYSVEDAGAISLQEMERVSPGWNQCCDGVCTDFWVSLFDVGKTKWRVQQALDAFQRKYPNSPRELGFVPCDFRREAWYSNDNFYRRNPWNDKDGCMRERFMANVKPMYSR